MTIAVALALYNGSKFLERQLDSLLMQSRRPEKVVICDDCSTDNSVDVVEKYIISNGLQNEWFVFVNEKNLGYARNFYRAVGLCSTDIVFFCDQDDIWMEDKIEKMMSIFASNPEISLLSCKYSVVDSGGEEQRGILIQRHKNTGKISKISVEDVLNSYRWPGMTMAFRLTFFNRMVYSFRNLKVPHDFMLAVLAADQSQFWELDYVGAYHRRHSGNAAREEHRIEKNLDLSKKLKDLRIYVEMLSVIVESNLPVSNGGIDRIAKRLLISQQREQALVSRNLWGILSLYLFHNHGIMRLYSFLGDFWLVCFGNYEEISNS